MDGNHEAVTLSSVRWWRLRRSARDPTSDPRAPLRLIYFSYLVPIQRISKLLASDPPGFTRFCDLPDSYSALCHRFARRSWMVATVHALHLGTQLGRHLATASHLLQWPDRRAFSLEPVMCRGKAIARSRGLWCCTSHGFHTHDMDLKMWASDGILGCWTLGFPAAYI
jgi:hypothetical protein